MQTNSQQLDEDLPCEEMPSGVPAVLVRGTVIESEHGPCIAPRGDFYLLTGHRVVYRARRRPRYGNDPARIAEVSSAPRAPLTIPAIRHLVVEVRNALSNLTASIEVFDDLYLSSRGPALTEETAPGFFGVVGDALQDQMVLALARLLDPSSDGVNYNVSTRQLVAALEATAISADLRAEYRRELAALDREFATLRSWRDKVIAHADLAEAFNSALDTVSIAVVRGIRDRLSLLVMDIARRVAPALSTDPRLILLEGPAGRLFDLLEKGLAAEEAELEGDD